MGIQLYYDHQNWTRVQVAKALGINRNSFYTQLKLEEKDQIVRNQIDQWYRIDDTLGHKKLAILLNINKKRASRVMHKYGITPRRKNKYHYNGKSHEIYENILKQINRQHYEVIVSDIFEFKLKDGTKVYCCFVIRTYTRQIIAFSYGYQMKADLVVETVKHINLTDQRNTEVIFHSDQGVQYGAEVTVEQIAAYGYMQSMSRAGTPTDNAIAERFVGIFKLAVVYRYWYETIGEFVNFAQQWLNFYNNQRPHEALKMLSPNQYARKKGLKTLPYLLLNCA